MRRTASQSRGAQAAHRPQPYRLDIELLEDRLSPGDVLLGHLLGMPALSENVAVLGPQSSGAEREAGSPRHDPWSTSALVLPPSNFLTSSTLVVSASVPQPGNSASAAPAASTGEPTRPVSGRGRYQELAGLDADALDQLIGDDFDTLSAAPSSASAHKALGVGLDDAPSTTPRNSEAGAPASGGSSSPSGLTTGGTLGQDIAPAGSTNSSMSPTAAGAIRPLSASAPLAQPSASPSGGGGIHPLGMSGGSGGTIPSDTPPIPDCSMDLIDEAAGADDHSTDSQSAVSPGGVRYFDGSVHQTTTDLSSLGDGKAWGQTRSWTNSFVSNNFNGAGEVDSQLPTLVQQSPGSNSTIGVISSGLNARYYDQVGGGNNYQGHYFLKEQLVHSTGQFQLTTTTGQQLTFYDFATTYPATQQGQLQSLVDPDGNVTTITYPSTGVDAGKPTQMQRSTTVSGTTTTESYLYTYIHSGIPGQPDPNEGLLGNVTLRRQVNGGNWSTVRQVAYDYYDGTSQKPYGNLGDLRTATVLDAQSNVLDTTYYRYYTSADAGTIGYVHGLKYVFSPASYARLVAAVGTPLTATDSQVSAYADNYYEYNPTSHQVTKSTVQANGCSACTGGLGTYTYQYSSSTNAAGYNSWSYKTIETLPDGTTNTVYANFKGEVMLKVYQSGTSQWDTFHKYDASGNLILTANPSAVTGYNESFADLLDKSNVGDYGYLNTTAGLIQVTDYGTSTTATETSAGDVTGYYKDTKVQQGSSGTPTALQTSTQYFAHTANGETVYPVGTASVYSNVTTNLNDPSAETTTYSYQWYTGTVQIQMSTVSRPIIAAAQNGPGVADTETRSYDGYGRVTQLTDADGFVTTTQYDAATGAVTQQVVDSGGTGHLNLTTNMVVDNLGRTTKLTDPNGNITYTVYNDANHEVRVYPGWTGTSTTGPTQVSREDRGHSPSYTETFTMSATPHVTSGQPDGTEAYANLQSLTRTLTSPGGQVTESDAYLNLAGVPYSTTTQLGTAGVNYYATTYAYDTARGWRTRVQSPTGTITRTVYDTHGRVVSTWVGTNDTPASGSWSPTNNTAPSNMVQVTANTYDDTSGGADGNLIATIQYPGGGATPRETDNYYDWRDRLVASKQGVQGSQSDGTHRPILYRQLDNLGEVTSSEQYDGDGVTLTSTAGVPNRPSASLLRAQTTSQYDAQGRVYQSNTYSVDQTNGTVSANSLVTNTWYDHRGHVIKSAPPGGVVTKTSYDGAGRPTVVYTTDAYLDSNWNDARTVSSNNNVLSQTETQYDPDGNALLVTTRDRFDNETAGGPLADANPMHHPNARVSYVANYYDAANRLTNSVNVGTNGGNAYMRPSTPAARSDTALVTTQGYQADAVQQLSVTCPPLGGASASLPTSSLAVGNHTITAIYSGDNTFPTSTGTLSSGETITSQATVGTTTTVTPSVNPQRAGQPVTWTATVAGATGPVNTVNFETGNFSQTATHTGGSIVTSPALDGTYSLQLQRNGSVANAEIRQSGTTYYNVPTAYYTFQFEYSSNPAKGGIANFQDTASGFKASLHLNAAGQLVFYPATYNGNLKNAVTGTTTLNANTMYTISAKIGTGSNAAWEIRINGAVEMSSATSGTADLGSTNNGSLLLGGGGAYTDTYYFDDVAIACLTYPGTMPTGTVQFQVDGSNYGAAVPLSDDTATSPATSTLTPGTHTITAVYSGDSTFPTSTGTLATGESVKSLLTADSTTTLTPSANPQATQEPVTWTATVTGTPSPVNAVGFETGDFSQTATHTNGAIVTSPALDGTYSLQLQRNSSVANAEIRQSGTTYYSLPTAYYSFQFEYSSNSGEGGIANFQDTASSYKAALHLNASGQLVFYPASYNGNLKNAVTGTTTLSANTPYTISAKIGTGSNAAWEIRINGVVEMSSATSGTADLGSTNNGSILLGGGGAYTDTYDYDDVAITAIDPVNAVNFETGDFSQTATHTGGALVTSPALDGNYALQLQRNSSVANAEIRQSGTTYYNLPTAYYSFQFEYSSNTGEGGIVNFQDTASAYKAALHLNAAGQLAFYPASYNGNLKNTVTGTTTLSANTPYTISAKIGTGSNAAWEIRINGVVEMSSASSGTADLGSTNNGSILLGGGGAYTDTYDYDDVTIACLTYPGAVPTGTVQFQVDGSNYGAAVALSTGTFTLSFRNEVTAAIPYNATAAAVQNALQSLTTIGANNVLVTGPAGGPWQVRFAGALAGQPEPDLLADGTRLGGGTVTVGTVSPGGDTGRVQTVTDPRGLVSKTDYDLLGRTLRTIDNFVAFAPSASADRTTQYTYDGDDHVLSLTAVLPGNVLQTTQYTYGVTGTVINSNDLLASVTYPANGKPSTETDTYNALGEVVTKTDRNGTTHSYSYDVLGRQTRDTVTAFGSGVDQQVKRLDTAYDTGDRPYLYTSYGDTGGTTIVNQVEQVYNGLGQLITEYQAHGGAVNLSTTPKVQYAYSFVPTSGGPNHSRLVSLTYPTGRVVTYNYNSGLDDRLSRLSALSDSSGTLESYAYLGLDTVIQRAHPQSGVNQSYVIPGGNSGGGDQYTGLDRFGRVIEQRWLNVKTSPNTVTDDFQYSYDRDGNCLTRTNTLNSSFSEQYSYDNLNQLTSFARGSHTQSWSLDAAGNWSSITTDTNPAQTRSHNLQNEITGLSGATTPTYDNNGNTTTDDQSSTYTYDAWNRLVKAVHTTTTATYGVDALGRRITTATNGGTPTDLFYSQGWQVLEEQVSGTITAQYVWSPVYVDALVERDAGGQRLYVQQDANWNVTAITDTSGNVQERYAYDPYGKASYYSGTWTNQTSSLFSWLYLHQGGRLDTTSGLYNFRNRDLSPTLGRWLENDPLGYSAGDSNLYRDEVDSPVGLTDPNGEIAPLLILLAAGAGALLAPSIANAPGPNEQLRGSNPFATTLSGAIQGTSLVYLPISQPVREAVSWGTGYGVASQLGGKLDDLLQGKPIRSLDIGDALSAGLLSGPLGPGIASYPSAAYPLLLGGVGKGAYEISQGNIAQGIVDLGFVVAGGLRITLPIKDTSDLTCNPLARKPRSLLDTNAYPDTPQSRTTIGQLVARDAPHQVEPGVRILEGVHVDDLGRVHPWRAHYDEFGRLIARTDWDPRGLPDIPPVHHHTYRWGPGMNPLETGSHIPGEFLP